MFILDFWGLWFVGTVCMITGICLGYWIGVAKTEPEYDVPKPPPDHDARARQILKDIGIE